MKAKEFIPQSKPRNFVAKNQKTSGAGAHKDKKKAQKQGDVKHKGKVDEMDKSQTPPGRDGGSSGGKEYRGKPLTAKQMMDKAHKTMMKSMSNDEKKDKGWRNPNIEEGLPQTLRKVVPGYAKREIDKKMDAGKFGKTDADKDANFHRYKKIQDKIKEQGEADYGPDYQDKVKRLGQMAKQGERKTVWDPVKRVYKTVPVNAEPQKK